VLKLLIRKYRYWHQMAEGHESRREAPSWERDLGRGCPPP